MPNEWSAILAISMSELKRYCLGFCFTEDMSQVVVLKKADDCKVEFLRGLWNGVGGVVHSREDTDEAMEREWIEETDAVSPQWVKLGAIWVTDTVVVVVFGGILDTIKLDTMKAFGREVPALAELWELGGPHYPLAPEMNWLVPMVHGQMKRQQNGQHPGMWRFAVDRPQRL